MSLYATTSEDFIVIALSSTTSGEARLIDANVPTQAPRLFLPRQVDHEYSLDHYRGRFYVRSNKDGKNFGLYETKESPVDRWKAVIAPIRTCCWRAMPCSRSGWCWRSAVRG